MKGASRITEKKATEDAPGDQQQKGSVEDATQQAQLSHGGDSAGKGQLKLKKRISRPCPHCKKHFGDYCAVALHVEVRSAESCLVLFSNSFLFFLYLLSKCEFMWNFEPKT